VLSATDRGPRRAQEIGGLGRRSAASVAFLTGGTRQNNRNRHHHQGMREYGLTALNYFGPSWSLALMGLLSHISLAPAQVPSNQTVFDREFEGLRGRPAGIRQYLRAA